MVSLFLTAVSEPRSVPIGVPVAETRCDVGEVDVGEGDDAAVGEVAGGRDLLGDRADQILRGDHRRVVGAGDGDVDLLGDQAAIAGRRG